MSAKACLWSLSCGLGYGSFFRGRQLPLLSPGESTMLHKLKTCSLFCSQICLLPSSGLCCLPEQGLKILNPDSHTFLRCLQQAVSWPLQSYLPYYPTYTPFSPLSLLATPLPLFPFNKALQPYYPLDNTVYHHRIKIQLLQ